MRLDRLAVVFTVLIPADAAAQQHAALDTVAPGVIYTTETRPEGPWRIHVLKVDLSGDDYRLAAVRPDDGLFGRERVSEMAARISADGVQVIAGINGDFFDLDTGENENNQVLNGHLLKGVRVADSPWDTFDNVHTQFAVGVAGRPLFERFSFSGTIERRGPGGDVIIFALDGLNGVPRNAAGLVLHTEARSAALRGDTIPGAVELQLSRVDAEAGQETTDRYRVSGGIRPISSDSINAAGPALAAYGPLAATRLDSLLTGSGPIRISYGLIPERGSLALLVGGWPRLVVDGGSVAAFADRLEGTFPDFSAERHARSAVGITRDSTTLLFVTVDGVPRGAETGSSVGMTLVEFADLLLSLGAFQALNLDGGGSTTLLVRDRVVNAPSDTEGERAVGNAVFVVRSPGVRAPERR